MSVSLPHAHELALARDAALRAGAALRSGWGSGSGIRTDAGKDIKLEADLEAEGIILEALRAGADHPVLSEEAGADPDFDPNRLGWVVDPLDGTLNYSRSLPLCCVSIALCRGEEPVLGLVHDFLRGVTYEGVPGHGAWCRPDPADPESGEPLQVSRVGEGARGVLCTGFPSGRNYDPESLLAFVGQARRYKKVRLLGSAALSLAWVAAGHADAYHEEDIHLWDVAAGLALVKAAGGTVDVRPGTGRWQRDVFASNGLLARPGG